VEKSGSSTASAVDDEVEQALADLVGYVLRHATPVRRALLYVEHDYGRDVRARVGDLLVEVDRERHPRSARELVWAAVGHYVGDAERRERAVITGARNARPPTRRT
jgi:hypothetical protein